MSPKVEKLDKWHLAQSLLKKSQIIESNQQRGKGRDGHRASTKPFRKRPHRISSIVTIHLIYQAASPNKAQAIKMSLDLVGRWERPFTSLKEKLALQNGYLIFLVTSYYVHCEPTIA